jgi:ABC-type transporter Mla MlaB component
MMMICDDQVSKVVALGGITDLVRGHDQRFIEMFEPLVFNGNISLDLSGVKRIDAAGVAALIHLYCVASNAGHEFKVLRAVRQVREVLGLVGWNRLVAKCNPAFPQFKTAA